MIPVVWRLPKSTFLAVLLSLTLACELPGGFYGARAGELEESPVDAPDDGEQEEWTEAATIDLSRQAAAARLSLRAVGSSAEQGVRVGVALREPPFRPSPGGLGFLLRC